MRLYIVHGKKFIIYLKCSYIGEKLHDWQCLRKQIRDDITTAHTQNHQSTKNSCHAAHSTVGVMTSFRSQLARKNPETFYFFLRSSLACSISAACAFSSSNVWSGTYRNSASSSFGCSTQHSNSYTYLHRTLWHRGTPNQSLNRSWISRVA